MKIPKDWHEFIALLNAESVDYLIVGAHAFGFHARPRTTQDLDFFIRATPENAARVERVLHRFGFSSLGLKAADFSQLDQIVQLGMKPNRIDIITSIAGVTFEEAWENRATAEFEGLPVNFIGREELIRNKRAVGRPRDLSDLIELENGES